MATEEVTKKINRRLMTKLYDQHYCGSTLPVTMFWRPVELVVALYPETAESLENTSPAVATYCPSCGELWVVVQEDDRV